MRLHWGVETAHQHTWEADGGVDPITLEPRKMSDRWDLVYKPGTSPSNPHTFYDSRAEAAADEASLKLIHKIPCPIHCTIPCGCTCDGECADDPTCNSCREGGTGCPSGPNECDSCIDQHPAIDPGGLFCHIGETPNYWENPTNGDPRLKGMAFLFADGQKGPNILTYRGCDDQHPSGISDSQIALIRKYLRWDVPLKVSVQDLIRRNHNYLTPNLSGLRPRLGSYELREPVQKLDFDGDGKRDLGYWEPPTAYCAEPLSGDCLGRFVVLLSSKGFSETPGQFLDVGFGGVGDVVVPADYNGDGRTDVAVYQPGGGVSRTDPTSTQAWWRWCLTASPAESTSCLSPPAPIQ